MGKYFTEKERFQLEAYVNKLHMKPKQISLLMGKHVNTIYNELKRGRIKQVDTYLREYYIYSAYFAQKNYKYNASAKGRHLKIENDYNFAEFIETKVIKEKYSLYSALVLASDSFNTDICLRTLYNYVYNGVFYNLTVNELSYKRRKKQKVKTVKKIYQFGKRYIDERPASIFSRSDFGHWEIDTVVGSQGSKSCLLVLSERKSRYELVFKLKNRQCSSVWRCLEKVSKKLGNSFNSVFKTVTCDNGVEFSTNYKFKNNRLKKFVQTNLYYCHPYRSSERGTNENQNKLIRRHIPKGIDISKYTDEQIKRLQNWINTMPRRLFGGLSSCDILKESEVYKILCQI